MSEDKVGKPAIEGRCTSIVLTLFGVLLTSVVLWVAWYFVDDKREPGTDQSTFDILRCMTLNELGDFFAGFAAALAFIWLVIGYFLQSAELRLQRIELGSQRQATTRVAEETKRQAEAVSANEIHARRDVFFRYAEILISDLRYLAADMLMNSSGFLNKSKDLSGVGFSSIVFDDLLRAISAARVIDTISRMYYNDRWPHNAKRYISGYSSLIDAADECDPTGETSKWLQSAPYGVLAKRMTEVVNSFPTSIVNNEGVHPGGDIKQIIRYFSAHQKSKSP